MPIGRSSSQDALNLRVGDYVEVRPSTEILATLDARGSLDGLPFMPEMIAYCGRRLRVVKCAHKTCDPTGDSNLRRLPNVVHLETRCDGSAHDGCQAGCLFFWRTEWLKRVDGPSPEHATLNLPSDAASRAGGCTLETLQGATRPVGPVPGEIRYRCQATELLRFSAPLSPYEPGQYVKDVSSGNISLLNFIRYFSLAAINTVMDKALGANAASSVRRFFQWLIGKAPKFEAPSSGQIVDLPRLDLQPGELVRVRSADEIRATLDKDGKHRGLSFDDDMAQRAGGTFRVSKRVERVIDERTGKMLRIRKDCIILDGVSCMGNHCRNRLFCPRGALQFWREGWLERVDPTGGTSAGTRRAAMAKKSEYV